MIVRNQPGTSYEDKHLAGNTTYYYVVSAVNSAGQSPDSAEVKAATQKSSPILVGHYEFEDNPNDTSPNGYQASAAGSPIYSSGRIGQAIDLDGVDDDVTLPPGVADSDDITLTAWVNWAGGGAWQRIFDFGNNTDQYLFLTPSSGDGTLRFAIKNGGSEQMVETSQLATGQWVHVAVALTGNVATLYVNGAPADTSNAVTINPGDFDPVHNYIGDSQWTADPFFAGQIDDFRIYNYALSAIAIARLARRQMDLNDLSILAAWWLWLTGDCGTNAACLDADINGDGKMDL